MRRSYRRRSPSYLMPFFILVGIGLIVVLAFQVWSNFQIQKGDVHFYLVNGQAKTLQYGTKDWVDAFNGSKLLVGDSFRTLGSSRVVLEFFNGTKIRLDENTQITLTDVYKNHNDEKIVLALANGSIWIDHIASDDVTNSQVEIDTPNLTIQSQDNTFAVVKDTAESVKVMKGNAKVSVLQTENKRDQLLPAPTVGIGQEETFDDALLKSFRSDENTSVLAPISDTFKNSDWYSWNSREDLQPTNFALNTPMNTLPASNAPSSNTASSTSPNPSSSATSDTSASTSPNPSPTASTITPPATSPVAPLPSSTSGTSGSSPLLQITQPAQKDIKLQAGAKFVIQGKVATDLATAGSSAIAKVTVHQNVAGKIEEYALKKFQPGDATFSYNLAQDYGNLAPGDNFYQFYGYDASGKKIATTDEVTIHYAQAATATTDTLSEPKVISFNGSTVKDPLNPSVQVTVGVVKVVGEIHGAQKVVVSGYTLQQYKAGATQWIFYANENGGNLKTGLNEYEVYGIGADGTESQHLKFTITYNKAGTTASNSSNPTPSPTPPTSVSPSPTPSANPTP